MKNYFSLTRIKLSEIFEDTYTFLKEKYNQSDRVFSEASPFGQLLSVINRLFGMNMYYIEDSITELNISTCSRPSSVWGLSRLAGHNPTRAQSAVGVISIKYNSKSINASKIIIPNFLKLKAMANNLSYIGVFSQDELVIDLMDAVTNVYSFKVYQGEIKNQKFTGTGEAIQTFECNSAEGDWIDEYFVNVYVNGVKYKKVDSLYDMAFQENACVVKTGITSGIDVIFGNGSFGSIPGSGAEIYVEYLITEGAFGNIDKSSDAYFAFEDVGYDENGNTVDLNSYFAIAMASSINLGSFPESTDLTKQLAPMVSRSMVLAQTSNYENFFKKMQLFSLVKVYTEYSMFDPYVDNIVYIFIIPDLSKRLSVNSNYFQLDLDLFKLTDYEKFNLYRLIEDSGQKIFGTVPYIIDPSFSKYGMNIYTKIWSNYAETDVKTNIINEISNYLMKFKRIDYLPKSDIIALIEGISGVDSVAIDFFDEKTERFMSLLLDKNQYHLLHTMYSDEFNGFKFTEADFVKIDFFYCEDPLAYKSMEDSDVFTPILDGNEDNEEYDYWVWEIKNKYNVSFKTLPWHKSSNVETAYNFLMNLDSVRSYINSRYDNFGNILLDKNTFPIFRGDYNDRFGNYISDSFDLSGKRLQPINLFFEKIDVSINNRILVNKNDIIN